MRVCLAEETHRISSDLSTPYLCNEMRYSLVIVQILRTFSASAPFQLFAGKKNQSNRPLMRLWQDQVSPCFTLTSFPFPAAGMYTKSAKVEIIFKNIKTLFSSFVYLKWGFISFPVLVFDTKQGC